MENLNQAEAGILLWIQENLRTEWLDHIMPYVSKINDHGILAIIGVIVLLLWTRYRKVGITAFGSLAVEFTIVNLLIKPNVQRIRPFYVLEDLHLLGSLPTDFSFPSGHTGSAFAVATVMLMCMPAKYGVTAIVISALIALSRLYNAAHYPTDKADNLSGAMKLTLLDDGSTDNDNRLGAVKDIAFAINKCQLIKECNEDEKNDGVLVLAGDNLLDFSIKGFIDFYKEKRATCIMRHFEPALEKLQRTGVVEVNDYDKVISMEEKPAKPKSNWAVPPFYIYGKDDLPVIVNCVNDEEINLDAPGGFIEWFCKKREVYAYEMPGKRYDIGNRESLEWIRENY